MNIALVSYEYPPETGGGGIGTYLTHAVRMLQERGHRVEVFAGGKRSGTTNTKTGSLLHRVECSTRSGFSEAVVPVFAERHDAVGFDVVEGPEYKADASGIQARFPGLPLVVKLHTSSWLLQRVNIIDHMTVWDKARFVFGALRRGRPPDTLPWTYDPVSDPERSHVLDADVVSAPSRSIRNWTAETFGVDKKEIRHDPYPFEADEAFLNVPVDTETERVTFVGRLEMRKGVLDLGEAIPEVLAQRPDTHFRFIGNSQAHPRTGEDLRTVLKHRLQPYGESVEFTGFVPYSEIPSYLSETDICVFPSLWENFPNVCLEAMSAGRGVVGSSSGGMSEMLGEGRYGNVVPSGDPSALAEAILDLLNHPERRKAYGEAARNRVLDAYNYDVIGPQQEDCYEEAIRRNESRPT